MKSCRRTWESEQSRHPQSRPERICARLAALGLLALAGVMYAHIPATPASALTIIREYVGPGERFEVDAGQMYAGSAPSKTVGGGELLEIFNAAADSWELAIRDEYTVTIQFGWAPLPVVSGIHNVRFQGGVPNRVIEGIVMFDNDGSTLWFLDPTPREHSEYPMVVECFTEIDGERINAGRLLSGGMGAAGALDLLSIAKHEIGHAIGLSTWNYQWVMKNAHEGIRLTPPRPFAGSLILTTTGGHLSADGPLMGRSLLPAQRKLISVLDVLVISEMGEYLSLNLHPEDQRGSDPLHERPAADRGC